MTRGRRTIFRLRCATGATGAAVAVALCAAPARAAAPVVEYLYPAGGQRGATVSVTAGGKIDKVATQVWTDHPGLKAQPAAGGGAFTLQIDKDVPPGAHLLRLYNAEGPSAPRVFVVGADPEAAEAEPNDELAKAQPVPALPATVNGRLDKNGDVDSYAVTLAAGQWLCASVQARRLGSPIDPMLHLCDAAGDEVAFAHDGLGLDPLLVFRAEQAGTYVVRVSGFAFPPAADVKLAGGAADVYRLRLFGGAPTRYAFPAGVRRGAKARVTLYDWAGESSTVDVDGGAGWGPDSCVMAPAAGADGGLRLELGGGPELTEPEATSAAGANPLAAPFAVTGRLEREGEEDAFRFAAKKGDRLAVTARAAALGSEMDPVVRVEDESGKVLANDDDGAGPAGGDARLQWEAGADGTFRVVVADLSRRGGPGFVYRLAVAPQGPAMLSATADADEYRVAPGKPATVKLSVARPAGQPGAIVAVATGLPAGVTATSADVPEKGGDVTLTLTAAPDAKPAGGPLRVVLLSADRGGAAPIAATCNLRKDAGQELVERTESLWLTVLAPSPAETKPPDAAKGK